MDQAVHTGCHQDEVVSREEKRKYLTDRLIEWMGSASAEPAYEITHGMLSKRLFGNTLGPTNRNGSSCFACVVEACCQNYMSRFGSDTVPPKIFPIVVEAVISQYDEDKLLDSIVIADR